MNDNIQNPAEGLDEVKHLASTPYCEAYGRTGIGGRSENQDSFGGKAIDGAVILTVCDGMGGMKGGKTASLIAATEIVNALAGTPSAEMNAAAIRNSVETGNEAVYRRALNDPPLRGMGTTATVLVITPQAAFLTHVGDSRIYQLRKSKKVFRTFDHSRVFEMVEKKMITEEQARTSSFSNIITRALGIRPTVDMQVEMLPYRKGDRFVLCCDGIWNSMPESDIISLFAKDADPSEAVSNLTEAVNAIGLKKGGGHDNLTAIIADVKTDSSYQYGMLDIIKRQWIKRPWQSVKLLTNKKTAK